MYTVVLVDDEIWALRDMTILLSNVTDFEIIGTFTDSVEAEIAIRATPPDVVLTDLKMEKMDGMALMNAVHEHSPSTKIIICSAYRNFDAARMAISHNVIDYLLKPINREQLQNVFDRTRQLLKEQPRESERYTFFRVVALNRPLIKPVIAQMKKEAGCPCRIEKLPMDACFAILSYDDDESIQKWISNSEVRLGFSRAADIQTSLPEMRQEALVALCAEFGYSTNQVIAGVQSYIAINYAHKLTLDTLATQFHFSSAHLSNYFHKKCGVSLFAFIKRVRVEMAAYLLRTTQNSVRTIAREVGFDDSSHFCRVFKAMKGLNTDAYRQQVLAKADFDWRQSETE